MVSKTGLERRFVMAKAKKQKGKMDMQAMMKIYHYPGKPL
jgi:hypothetical protein